MFPPPPPLPGERRPDGPAPAGAVGPPPPPLPADHRDGGEHRSAMADRPARRRRSAQVTPALVERMDVADDAIGRVAIFSVDGNPLAEIVKPPAPPSALAVSLRALSATVLNSRYIALVAGNLLVLALILGLSLTH